ncbi:MAG: hypothetical protein AAGB26_02510 [Planctomycetota bacterium]
MSEEAPAGCLGFLARLGIKIDMDNILPVDRIEAEFYPFEAVGRAREFAELEYTSFRSGVRKLEIEVEDDCGVPPASQVSIKIHGVQVCRVVTGPRDNTEISLRSDKCDEAPTIKPGILPS